MTNAEARFNKIHIRKVYACLAVTCHLNFWQNDWDLLLATAVTQGWNGYRNMSHCRKLTPEKKIIPALLLGLEPGIFRSRGCRSATEPSHSPCYGPLGPQVGMMQTTGTAVRNQLVWVSRPWRCRLSPRDATRISHDQLFPFCGKRTLPTRNRIFCLEQVSGHPSSAPVSYTHLTLPTSCCV